ncbi:TIGR03557 family F420-dependent LLM class oxidoreductase [Amycolatopsis acidiphila]|uniref:TIGR03557 family F420-dependent LLM class oxidoreductase n=1 Tax=Amycolatopsis acidiphila TaxID=715473 RepID=A0A558AH79_9PSEU|nr:TIGR03557 family F420-dependent LLM class oxidoreductase [Amycolatopsis acidiphila]TVT23622.1 TIGR03557 family F420-dependent LLM class oxidoreductase [Amycolatopsis acidiphila]UIJ58608.1 TIGR03557 family F420-dependent LLM class oxidoreductase [Amycolatopsis acidiphila]GHG76512.1 LLM class F420-dependent oxidoreductase [Amycolatopsis acidiphila]
MRFGYTLMTEQAGPKDLVRHAKAAEECGFEFEVSSDHYSPWLDEQGHAPYAWSVLGAVSQVTDRVELLSFVTCPTMRYHPAVVAQKAATVSLLSDDRFILGLGAGENLNEHVVGRGWPPANVRHEMLTEAVEIIGELFDGGYVNFAGKHYRVDSAKLWDLPERRTPIALAVSGRQSVERFAPVADALITTEPNGELIKAWDSERAQVREDTTRKFAQLPVSFDTDREAAERRAHEQFRWFSGGWKVNAELPGTSAFAGATQYVKQADVAESIPCGSDVDAIVEAVKPFADAGFTDLALVQIGGDQQDGFFEFASSDLLPALHKAYA